MKVYIVDDDPIMASTLERYVQEMGHETHTFHSALEAWETHQTEPASLIFSDWKMPGLNGLDFCEKVRLHPEKYTYFVLFTGVYTSEQDYLLGIRAGADTFLKKPLSRESVQGRLLAAERILQKTKESLLREVLRICCFCKHVCPVDNEWETLETFIRERLGIQFSHGVCPNCFPEWLKTFKGDLPSSQNH